MSLKMNQEQFLKYCIHKGIHINSIPEGVYEINSISRKDLSGNKQILPCDGDPLPNKFNESIILDGYISLDRKYTILDVLEGKTEGMVAINIVRIIQNYTNLSIKACKDLWEANKDDWYDYPQIKKIKKTPKDKLPLIVNEITLPNALKAYEDKLSGKEI